MEFSEIMIIHFMLSSDCKWIGVSQLWLCVPKLFVIAVLHLIHLSKLVGHPGIHRSVLMKRCNYIWGAWSLALSSMFVKVKCKLF